MGHSNVILSCLVYGDPFDKVFEVEVAESRHVAYLKKLVQAEVGDEFLAKDLILWGVNIRIGDMTALEELRLEENQPENGIRKLFPGDTIQEVLPNQAYDYVHVLVVLPDKRGIKRKVDDTHIDVFERKLDKLIEKVDSLKDDGKLSISISRVNQTQFQELLAEHHLRRRTVELEVPPCEKQVRAFVWNPQIEGSHGGTYLEWLNDNISLPDNLEFYPASAKSNLLSTGLASARYKLNGTLDTLIVEKAYVKDLNIVAGVRVGIEKREVMSEKDCIQAVVQLIAADIYSNYSVVILLTDLRNHWQFFWFQVGYIASCTLDLRRGIKLLEAVVSTGGPTASTGTLHDDFNLTQCTFSEAISRGKKSKEIIGDFSKTVGMDMLLKRQKVDLLQTLLPEDTIADMRDVYDVMSPAEVRKWEMEKVLELAVKTPAIQSTLGSSGWKSMYG